MNELSDFIGQLKLKLQVGNYSLKGVIVKIFNNYNKHYNNKLSVDNLSIVET